MDNFFYDMNKKLKDVLDTPKSVNQQLNERAEHKPVEEGMFDSLKAGMAKAGKAAKAVGKKGLETLGHGSDADMIRDLQKKMGVAQTGEKPRSPIAKEEYGPMESIAGSAASKFDPSMHDRIKNASKEELSSIATNFAGDGFGSSDRWDNEYKLLAQAQRELLGSAQAQNQLWASQRSQGIQNRLDKTLKTKYPNLKVSEEGGTPMTPKQKKFAKLAPPADKITFADKIAGAKKEVDEMLGDVAADAMRKAVGKKVVADEGSTGDYSAKKARAGKDIGKPGKNFDKIAKSAAGRGGKKVAGAVLANLRGKKESAGEMDEGWDDMLKDVEKRRGGMKTGEKIQGHKGEIEKTATGIRHTRKYDPKTGETDTGDSSDAQPVKRGRGRPKKTDRAPERVTAKAYKHKGGRVAEQGEEELDEKAVSKAQQKFMGMVHAAQKGEKPASKEVAKVAKSMKKKDVTDFASTKHKGLPEKKKREKTKETAGDTPKAATNGGGMQFGKGIYDSLNREIENIIAESMNVSMSDSTEGGKSLTISATEEDAVKLAAVLKLAGVAGGQEGGVEVVGTQSPISGDEGACPTCGSHDCGCGDIEEALDENQPDWPTDEVTSDDALQYAGGLNKPKTTVAGNGQTTVPVTAVQVREEEEELGEQEQVMAPESIEEAQEMCEVCEAVPCKCDENVAESLARFRSLAGIQEAAKPDYIDLDKDGDKEEPMKKAAADKAKEENKKVDESIFKLTNLWKAYKG